MALDQGTTSSRCIIFNEKTEVMSMAQREFKQIYPKPGWVEHNAMEIWASQFAVVVEAMAQKGIKAQDIKALGITNQRETIVCWNEETGLPIYNAIVWQDKRTTNFCEHLKNKHLQSYIQSKTGLIIDPYFSATKLHWILENVPEAKKLMKANKLLWGTIDTWLVWNFTRKKVYATDVTNASRTMLFNIHNLQWDKDLLKVLGFNEISYDFFPTVKNTVDNFGFYEKWGIPICAVIGDQQSATFGQACFEPGMVKNTYGTGCFILMNTGSIPYPSKNQLITTIAWKIQEETTYALEGAIFSAGASIQWLEEVGIVKNVQELSALAQTIKENEGVYLVPAFAGLGAPQWDPTARGTILGLTRGSTKAHLARAALESMAFQSQEVIQLMSEDCKIPIKELRVDGGASQDPLLMQFQADISQVQIIQPQIHETTALGAALLAGFGAGLFKNLKDIQKIWKLKNSFFPQKKLEWSNLQMKKWKKAVERSMHWETE